MAGINLQTKSIERPWISTTEPEIPFPSCLQYGSSFQKPTRVGLLLSTTVRWCQVEKENTKQQPEISTAELGSRGMPLPESERR